MTASLLTFKINYLLTIKNYNSVLGLLDLNMFLHRYNREVFSFYKGLVFYSTYLFM